MTAPYPTNANYVIGLVLYHPEDSLLRRLDEMVALGFQVYVFDNSPFVADYSRSIQDNLNICYLTAGKNVGIAYALSTLCATAYARGNRKLLFLDQDTSISGQTLQFIETFTQSLPPAVQQQYAALVFSGQLADDHLVQEVRLAISSGSLFNLPVLQQIGWHNEKYFVDCVDYELCVRARRNGFKIGLVRNTPDFDHVSEQPDRAINLFGKQFLFRRYSATRIKDATGAYIKLIIGNSLISRPSDTYTLIRSMGLYIFGQLISRLIAKK